MSTEHVSPVLAALAGTAAIGLGVWLLVLLDLALAGRRRLDGELLLAPLRGAARLLGTESRRTEVTDRSAWLIGPVLVLAVCFAVLAALPLAPGTIGAEIDSGLVLYQGLLGLVPIGVHLTGWGPNSPYPLVGGFRFVGQYLAYEMPFILTVIAVALPARSLELADVVAAQEGLWNVVLQPLGFAIYVAAALGITFYGPLALPQGRDLAGGVEAELSGAHRLVWLLARWTLLLTVSVFAVPLFLGGWSGPVLPPMVWTVLKALAVAAVLVGVRGRLATIAPERFLAWAWKALIPLSFVNIFVTGVILLVFPRMP